MCSRENKESKKRRESGEGPTQEAVRGSSRMAAVWQAEESLEHTGEQTQREGAEGNGRRTEGVIMADCTERKGEEIKNECNQSTLFTSVVSNIYIVTNLKHYY